MNPSTLQSFFEICGKLKNLKRTGWVYRGVQDPESVADHSWRVAMMSFFIEDPTVDKVHCMKMGLVHDLAESIVGDITPVDDVSVDDKHQMELGALSTIVADFPQPLKEEFLGLWTEYEEQKTLESNYVFDFDKLDMLVQAEEYESEQGINLQEFFDSTEALFKTPYGKSQIEVLKQKRTARLSSA